MKEQEPQIESMNDKQEPADFYEDDILKLMESTGRIKQGGKVYESFDQYV